MNTTLTPAAKAALAFFSAKQTKVATPAVASKEKVRENDPMAEAIVEVLNETLRNLQAEDGTKMNPDTGARIELGNHSINLVIPGEKRQLFKDGKPVWMDAETRVVRTEKLTETEKALGKKVIPVYERNTNRISISLLNLSELKPVKAEKANQHNSLIWRLQNALPFVEALVKATQGMTFVDQVTAEAAKRLKK